MGEHSIGTHGIEPPDKIDINPPGVLPEVLLGPQNSPPLSLEFTSSLIQEPMPIATGLTTEHLYQIAKWEETQWGDSPKSLSEIVDQFRQEVGEERDVWIGILEGRLDLGEDSVMHNLRDEIDDGIFASVGILRTLINDDLKVAQVLAEQLPEDPGEEEQLTPELKITLYGLKSQRFLDLLENALEFDLDILDPHDLQALISEAGEVIRSGANAIRALEADPGMILSSKIKLNGIKYSRPRIVAAGSRKAAKQSWEKSQLRVVSDEVVLVDAAA